jgi:two-component sensor histidine kinase
MRKHLISTPTAVIGISLVFGLLFWIVDGYFEFLFFHDNLSFLLLEGPETYLESIIFKVPPHSLFVRVSFIIGSLLGGVMVLIFINQRKKAEEALQNAHDELEQRVTERTTELADTNITLKQEIQDRKRAEAQINASLVEKEALLREVHHRVKNNFEIISSLLDISAMQTENGEIQNLWEDMRSRIFSMAMIHAQLYENERFDRIDMGKHIQRLIEHISDIYERPGKSITSMIESSKILLSVNQAIPCALAMNEIITNAFKHAFIEKSRGKVSVYINNTTDGSVLMKVKDDGDGLPDGVDLSSVDGLGIKLATQLVDGQLNGRMWINRDHGTEISIEFKKH